MGWVVARARFVGMGLLAVASAASAAWGCDICAVYTATELQETRTGIRAGVAEQYTRFGKLQEGGQEVPNTFDQYIDSSITQLFLGYNFVPRFGVQFNVPIIDRKFQRPLGAAVQAGDVKGFGDVSLLANGLAYSLVTESSVLRLTGLFGLKFPSGNPSLLQEELVEDANPEEPGDPCKDRPGPFCLTRHLRHTSTGTATASAVHGHDLTLGSGSTDVLFGGQGLWTWNRLYGTAGLQYAVRTTGAFGYRFANDLNAAATVGWFVLLQHDLSLGLEAVVGCETKGDDTLDGSPETDTALTALYAGPGARFTWQSALSAELVADLPAIENNSGLQVVPTYRLRGGLVWHF
jgi:hypothetical protein